MLFKSNSLFKIYLIIIFVSEFLVCPVVSARQNIPINSSRISNENSLNITKTPWFEKKMDHGKRARPIRVVTSADVMTLLPSTLSFILDQPQNESGTPPSTAPRDLCLYNLRRYGVSFETRVNGCAQLARQIIWETPTGEKIDFNHWPQTKIDRINEIYHRIQFNQSDLGVQCPRPEVRVNVVAPSQLYMTENEAFDIYAAHVAHSIYLESTGLHPWSLLDIPSDELSILLDSSNYHSRIRRSYIGSLILGRFQVGQDYTRPAWEFPWMSLSCDPRWTYRYLRGEYNPRMGNVLGANEEETLKKLTWWFYKNSAHAFGSDADITNPDRISDSITLIDRLAPHNIMGPRGSFPSVILRLGCHSGGVLMLDFARALNLPLLPILIHAEVTPYAPYSLSQYQHLGIAFQWSRSTIRILDHVDNMYTYFRTFYPIDNSGNPLGEEGKLNLLMDTIWVTPSYLTAHGFHVVEDFPKILPDREFLPGISGNNFMITQDMGNIGGYWEHFSNRVTSLSIVDLERQYQLCSWPAYLQSFCAARSHSVSEIERQIDTALITISPWVDRLPNLHTSAEHRDHAEQCIRAYGGCDAIERYDADFYNDFGQGVYGR